MKLGRFIYGFSLLAVLSACGGGSDGGSDAVSLDPPKSNSAPVADAGVAQSVLVDSLVVLDGSASSDADNDALTYAWTLTVRPPASVATLSNSASVKPTFTADSAGTYVARLVVSDQSLSSPAATVTINASEANAAPVADAGPAQNVVAGDQVTLDGSGSSDANGDSLSYSWSLTSKPAGSSSVLAMPTSVQPTFTTDLEGTYVATLVVSDGNVSSAASTVTITASVANSAPVADAGEAQDVMVGTLVTFDGSSSSDANHDPLTYSWTMTSRPDGSEAALVSATSAHPTLMPDVAGTYVATLIVSDGMVASEPATVVVTVSEVAEALTLLKPSTSPFGGGTDTVLTMPYSVSASNSATITCVGSGCGVYDVATYRLRANGRSFRITDLQAVNTTSGSALTPLFDGLQNNQVIGDGETVTFKLQSPLTNGATVNLQFFFRVVETGETFSHAVALRTN
mgnify:FL=1